MLTIKDRIVILAKSSVMSLFLCLAAVGVVYVLGAVIWYLYHLSPLFIIVPVVVLFVGINKSMYSDLKEFYLSHQYMHRSK